MKIRKLLLVIFAAVQSLNIAAGNPVHKVYMYGFAASFNDSTVYFTEIQEVDSAYIGRSKFLYNRENYSYQLQNFLRSEGVAHPTCITSFARDRKKVEKKYLAMKKRYMRDGNYTIKYVSSADFVYRPIVPQENDIANEKLELQKTKAERKAAKRAEREAQKRERRRLKQAEKGIIAPQEIGAQNTTK